MYLETVMINFMRKIAKDLDSILTVKRLSYIII